MKVYCAIEYCRHHAASSSDVGFVDFPSAADELRRWLALTWVRHVVRGVTRLCTDHFPADQLLADPEWERRYPGQVNPNPSLQPGVVPSLLVPGWVNEDYQEDSESAADPPSMFVRQEGSSARRVRPTARLREAHSDLFDGLPPAQPLLRRPRGRPPKGRRGRPPDRRRPSPPPDLSNPEVRARLVQQALDEYDWRQERARETGLVRAADGTETLYVSVPTSDDDEEEGGRWRRGGTAVRSRRGRGVKRRRGSHGAGRRTSAAEPEETPPAERLPPNTSQRFREVLAAQREVQALVKQLEGTPAPVAESGDAGEVGGTEDGSLIVLRDGDLLTEPLLPESDNYSAPTSLEVALGLLHQQRLENLRLRADLLRSAIRDRQRSAQQQDAHQQVADANRMFQDRLGDMFTPAQVKLIQNRSLRRTHMWDTVDIKRAIGLRRLCTRRAYAYVKDELHVPLPGLAVLRGSSQRDPETALMYTQMVDGHRLKHMTKRARQPRLGKGAAGALVSRPGHAAAAVDTEGHVDHKYIVLTAGKDGVAGEACAGHMLTDPGEASDLMHSVQAAQAAGQTVLVDATGAPLLVDRAAGQTPPPEEHFLMLVPEEEEDEVEEQLAVEPARSPPHRPGILRAPLEPREPARPAATAARPRFKLVVKGDGEVLTEDGRPLEEISWPAGLHWMDAAQVNFAETPIE